MPKTIVKFRIKRSKGEGRKPYFITYEVPVGRGMSVLEGLWHIVDNLDGSLSFRYSCRGAVCGSCAMMINGIADLACRKQISSLPPHPIEIEPLPYFSVLKDLVVDMEPFFEKLRSIKPYFESDYNSGKENLQSPEQRKKIAKAAACILCAACQSACPLVEKDKDYLGPAILTAVNRFGLDSRDKKGKKRFFDIGGKGSGDFDGCMKISRCTQVCPRDIEPSERIEEIKKYLRDHSKIKSKEINIVCGYCSTGCGLTVINKEDNQMKLITNSVFPVNKGKACPKGWEALTPMNSKDRAARPYWRNEKGALRAISWDEAIARFRFNFQKIQKKYGKDSVAFLSTGQIPVEEMVFLGTLAKFGMGIRHGDGNTRQCMASSVVAYKQSFGFDAPPYTYKDYEESDLLIFVGANPFISHPIMWERLSENKNQPFTIVVDPRYSETAHWSNMHLAIKPKKDPVFFYGLANILIERGFIDKDFIEKSTEGFSEYKEFVKKFTLGQVSKETGISEEKTLAVADLIQKKKRASFWWAMGINQSYMGTRTAQSIINLALMTGNIGKPGTGANSITGQCNAMGSRIFSNTTCLLAGHDFENPEQRKKIAAYLNIDASKIPQDKGWAYDRIVEGIKEGTIKGLWVIGTNPVHSGINNGEFKKILKNLEYLIVQDIYATTETARFADLFLPAAGWGEKQGVFINSERRISLLNKVKDPPGEALSDFEIFKRISQKWGCAEMFKDLNSPEDVFQTMKKISKGQPCDITGISGYAMLKEHGGVQWPFPEGAALLSNERRLFEDGKFFTQNGKALFLFEEAKGSPEPVDKEYPVHLVTERGTIAQWNTQTRTAKSDKLKKNMSSKDICRDKHKRR